MVALRNGTSKRSLGRNQRRGVIVVFAALFMVVLIAMVAFAVDIGYLMVAQTDLQRAADAAAHAAVLEYRSEDSISDIIPRVRNTAKQYVEDNEILNSVATVTINSNNAVNGDILVGRIDFEHPRNPMTFGNPDEYNAVRVRVRRTVEQNGEVPLFFARVLGHHSLALQAEATAAIIRKVSGIRFPPSGEIVPLLPITIRQDFWHEALAASNDVWAFDSVDESISADADGVPEVTLFPNSTESSGNLGTLNIGTSANSTNHLADQIRDGLTQSDLDYHGGELALDDYGELLLSGDPGLSASVKDDLAAIAGKPVMIPLYKAVDGSGSNAEFIIVEFVGVRVMAVNLTGNKKFVSVQPADVTFAGTIQSPPGEITSKRTYSPPVIVQ